MKIYFYLCMDALRKNPFIPMYKYLTPGQDKIIFQWIFIFASYTIRVITIVL